jgi:hypothetical protein
MSVAISAKLSQRSLNPIRPPQEGGSAFSKDDLNLDRAEPVQLMLPPHVPHRADQTPLAVAIIEDLTCPAAAALENFEQPIKELYRAARLDLRHLQASPLQTGAP